MDEPYPPAQPAETPPRSPGWRSWLIAGVAAGVLAVVAIVGVSVLTGSNSPSADPTEVETGDTTEGSNAQGGGPGQGGFGRGTFGTITAIDGTSLTVDSSDPSGATTTVTVETNANTTFTETVEGSIADLVAGDNVVVMGEEGDTGIVAASITDSGDREAGGGFGGGPPGDRPSGKGGTPPSLPDGASVPEGATRPSFPGGDGGGFTVGTISSIDGATFVVETDDDETVTVTTTGDTTVQVTREITLADLAEGDSVSAMGDTEDDVVLADSVRVGGFGFPGGRQQP